MDVKTVWERAKVEGKDVLGHVQRIVAEGNARRIIIKQKGAPVAEFPLTVGVVGAVLAPVLAAIGAIAALATECTVEIERTVTDGAKTPAKAGNSTKKKARRSTARRS